MEAAAAMKNENNISQKGYGGAPLGGMAAMAVSVMPKNKNNIIESIIKTNKEEVSQQLEVFLKWKKLPIW